MYLEWVGAGSADGDHLRDLAGLALGPSIAELKVAVIGLGYVGLPLAVALANHCRCTGYEIDLERVDELRQGLDRTGEITPERLGSSKLAISADEACLAGADVYIVTVPTPVREDNTPDLSMVEAASVLVGRSISSDRTAVIVYESTVFPGVTEEFCGPILERVSGLRCGKDFYLGYSPERINPGDKENTVDKVCKVVSGQTPEVLSLLTKLYGQVTTGGIHQAKSIRVAEAAKVVENTQRDLNIAFMNQLAQGFDLMDISIWDVLETAGTKWNFLKFRPGMVGGHCIGVDPYYLIHRVNELNGSSHPDVDVMDVTPILLIFMGFCSLYGVLVYSFSDRHRGTLIDQRALVQCEEAKAKDELINYLRYVKVEEDQVRAASENAFLRNKLSSLEEGNAKMRALLAANFITISEFEEYSITTEMIRSRINQNDIALSRDNAFDKSLDLLAAINRVREATRRLYDISHKVRTAGAWDIGTQTGLRAPINGHNGVAPFGALSLRYSFGKGVSERSAKLATEYATKAMDEDVGGVLSSVHDAMRNYAEESELVERNEIPLTAARADEYGRILVSIDGVDTGRAQLVRAQAIARKVYNEAILSGLKARVKFMKAQSPVLQQGS